MTNISKLEQHLLDIRRAALSAVKQAEAGLQAIGRPVESAVMTREERRKAEHALALSREVRDAYDNKARQIDTMLEEGVLNEKQATVAMLEVRHQFAEMMGGDFRYFDTG